MENKRPLPKEQQIREEVRRVLNTILDEEYDILLEKLKDNPNYLFEKRANNLSDEKVTNNLPEKEGEDNPIVDR